MDQPRNYIAKSIHRWVAIEILLLDHIVQLALKLHMAYMAPVGVVAMSETLLLSDTGPKLIWARFHLMSVFCLTCSVSPCGISTEERDSVTVGYRWEAVVTESRSSTG